MLDTLQRLGVSPDQIQTEFLQVTPEMVYPGRGCHQRCVWVRSQKLGAGWEVLRLEQTGIPVDAGLAKGSTGIGGLQFYSSKAAEARREALSKAVIAARLDAEAMAKAAGYQLGELLEIVGSRLSTDRCA